jgi:hypothetical protein
VVHIEILFQHPSWRLTETTTKNKSVGISGVQVDMWFSYEIFACTTRLSNKCYIPHSSHTLCFHNSNNIWRGVQIMRTPHYANFSSLFSFHPSYVEIFFSAPSVSDRHCRQPLHSVTDHTTTTKKTEDRQQDRRPNMKKHDHQ